MWPGDWTGKLDEAVLEQAGTDEQSRTERDDASGCVGGDRHLPRLVALDRALDEQNRDWIGLSRV